MNELYGWAYSLHVCFKTTFVPISKSVFIKTFRSKKDKLVLFVLRSLVKKDKSVQLNSRPMLPETIWKKNISNINFYLSLSLSKVNHIRNWAKLKERSSPRLKLRILTIFKSFSFCFHFFLNAKEENSYLIVLFWNNCLLFVLSRLGFHLLSYKTITICLAFQISVANFLS